MKGSGLKPTRTEVTYRILNGWSEQSSPKTSVTRLLQQYDTQWIKFQYNLHKNTENLNTLKGETGKLKVRLHNCETLYIMFDMKVQELWHLDTE